MKRHAPATSRNREPIVEVLRTWFTKKPMTVLEIAGGSGEHAVCFSQHLPHVTWQPTDADPEALTSIEAWRADARLPNVLPPVKLDVTSDDWGEHSPDAIVCINMIHIAPWSACEGLIRGAGRVLRASGLLYLYGPYCIGGRFTAPSNEAFDASLKHANPAWGVRHLEEVTELAARNGLSREAVIPMPANNHSIVFRRD